MARNDNMVAALLRERAAYAARGDQDRVEQVNEQLRHYGATDDEINDTPGGTDDKTVGGPNGRAGRGSRQRTTAADK